MPDLKPMPKPKAANLQKKASNQFKPPRRVDTGRRPITVPPKPAKKAYQSSYKPKHARRVSKEDTFGVTFKRRMRKTYRFVRKKRLISLAAAAILAVVMASLLIWSMTGNNAFAVYLDEERFGYIAFSQEINENILTFEAVSRLEAREVAQLSINERITLIPANAPARRIIPYHEAIEQLAQAFTFQIVGTEIEVMGTRVAVLRTERDAEEVVWRLQSPFLLGRSIGDFYAVEFVEEFNLRNVVMDEGHLNTVEYAFNRLNVRHSRVEEYIVQPGDTLGGIALRHNTTLAQLQADNPDLSAILQVGQSISIHSYMPLLSVRTVEAITREEVIPIENEYHENPGQSASFSYVLQHGTEGLQEVVVHITRINGVQIGAEDVIATRVIVAPTPNIIEVGTL